MLLLLCSVLPRIAYLANITGTIFLIFLKQALGLFDCILLETIGLRIVGTASDMLEIPFAGKAFESPTCMLWNCMECHEQQTVVLSSCSHFYMVSR